MRIDVNDGFVLADTNVYARTIQANDPFHEEAILAMRGLRRTGHTLCLVPQNLYELWVVATRPLTKNGYGLSPSEAEALLDDLAIAYTLVRDVPEVYDEWLRLVLDFQIAGVPAHDARLVAAMRVHGISNLLTYNTRDFVRYPGINLLHPLQVVETSPQK